MNSIMKNFLLSVFVLLTATVCLAQNDHYGWRTSYNNFGHLKSTLSLEGMHDLKSSFGFSYTTGKTYYLHAPIAGIMRFGIDVTWFDLNYAKYKVRQITHMYYDTFKYYQGDVSVHIGPSVSLQLGWLNIHGYIRYAPTYSVLYTSTSLYSNYATYFIGGASISLGGIGLGVESRMGERYYDPTSSINNGRKVYLTFRF